MAEDEDKKAPKTPSPPTSPKESPIPRKKSSIPDPIQIAGLNPTASDFNLTVVTPGTGSGGGGGTEAGDSAAGETTDSAPSREATADREGAPTLTTRTPHSPRSPSPSPSPSRSPRKPASPFSPAREKAHALGLSSHADADASRLQVGQQDKKSSA
ncbi:hypothetical protein B0A50_06791 [Salinomyces thailandicus]|uniref:Uncharacterized protein n=1 Tax=Salinomyces thailandicus TaxID=706561 RepID=A0A4U0TQD7_9PEZI|nr:hypothetical protein B0A50_06791 [Salinomyces thailandica]